MNDISPPLEIPRLTSGVWIPPYVRQVATSVMFPQGQIGGPYGGYYESGSARLNRALKVAAPGIVATELRRLAGVFAAAECRDEAAVLLGRADELDPRDRRDEQADNSWFAPAIPVSPPTGEVRVRRARPDGPDDV